MNRKANGSTRPDGFTLVEVLVAMAVLGLVLVLMLQMVESLMRSTRVQNQQMDSAASARHALDILEADLSHAVIARDSSLLASLSSNTTVSLLCRRRGPENASGHRFLAVAYAANNKGQLLRAYESIPFGETNLLRALEPTDENSSPVAEGVLSWQVRAVTDGNKAHIASPASTHWATNRYNGLEVPAGYQAIVAAGPAFASGLTNRTRALEVWVAALDPQGFSVLVEAGALTNLQSSLRSTEPEAWRGMIDSMDLPPQVKSAARVLQKTIPLP